jgi:hypothetical protein
MRTDAIVFVKPSVDRDLQCRSVNVRFGSEAAIRHASKALADTSGFSRRPEVFLTKHKLRTYFHLECDFRAFIRPRSGRKSAAEAARKSHSA